MLRQIQKLTAVQLCNLFGFNEFRHTRDSRKKRRYLAMAALWILLAVMLLFYIIGLCAGLTHFGMTALIPEYLYAITSLIILFFSFFKAGSIIYQKSMYDMLAALPITKTSIVVSRFLTMYFTNLLMSFAVMLPGLIWCGAVQKNGPLFYMAGLAGTLFLPLLPITLAAVFGAGITAISARMKNKSLVSATLSVVIVLGILALTYGPSGNTQLDPEILLQNLMETTSEQIHKLYPPAAWFGTAVSGESAIPFLLQTGASVLLFALLVCAVQSRFQAICSALNAAPVKNAFSLQHMKATSPVKALFRREIKRYFASSIYITNTIIGPVLMVATAVALLFAGPERLDSLIGFPGITKSLLPLLLSITAALMPTTACCVSMEGKHWWLVKTLPIKNKALFDSKILVNLSIACIPYCIAVICSIAAIRPALIQTVWLVLTPAVYILFSSVIGITLNLAVPLMNWDTEVRVVKQSASTALCMLVNVIAVLLPVGLIVALPNAINRIMGVTLLILLGAACGLYMHNNKKTLLPIG